MGGWEWRKLAVSPGFSCACMIREPGNDANRKRECEGTESASRPQALALWPMSMRQSITTSLSQTLAYWSMSMWQNITTPPSWPLVLALWPAYRAIPLTLNPSTGPVTWDPISPNPKQLVAALRLLFPRMESNMTEYEGELLEQQQVTQMLFVPLVMQLAHAVTDNVRLIDGITINPLISSTTYLDPCSPQADRSRSCNLPL